MSHIRNILMLDISKVSTVRGFYMVWIMTFFFNQITTPIYVFCVNVYFLTTFCIFVCSCVCWHHLAINIWLWHMWLHIPCSHVSIVQLSSIRTLWQFFFLLSSLSSMPTHSALKTKITTPLLAICCKTPLPLVAWGYEMQTLTGIANKVWELPLCIPLWNNFPKIKILLYKLLFELQCWPWIYQSMCHSSESLLDCKYCAQWT